MRATVLNLLTIVGVSSGFLTSVHRNTAFHRLSYSQDQADYSPKETDFEKDDETYDASSVNGEEDKEGKKYESTELGPVPMSKNAGNRFIVILWDRLLDSENRHMIDLHDDRIQHTEDHVIFCRKSNLYNETFNSNSMVDVLFSRQLLSSDLRRVIGQVMCLESTDLKYVRDMLQQEPLVQFFTSGDLSEIPIYRWRHIRDFTLRQDDGRDGTPAMLLALDESGTQELRQETNLTNLEYLIRSERVIATGPLHLCTDTKDDLSSKAIGDLMFYNAVDRDAAIQFAEEQPRAQGGLYKSMQTHFYNNLDVTGKFVADNRLVREPITELKEAMEVWGYPTDDDQTPWINW